MDNCKNNTINTINKKEYVNNDKVVITKTISELEIQLQNIFKSDVLNHDFTILNGFLIFAQSKLMNFLDSNMNLFINTVRENKNQNDIQVGIDNIMTLLTLSWERLWNPIYRWFQSWHQSLVSVKDSKKIKYPEFRRLNSHLSKFSKMVNGQFMKLMDNILSNLNIEDIIPYRIFIKNTPILNEIDLKIKEENVEKDKDKRIKIVKDNLVLIQGVILIVHRCLLYLGCVIKYKSIMIKASPNNFMTDFRLSLKFIENSIILLPSLGESYFQRSLIELQCNHIGLTVYDLLRASLSSFPHGQALSLYQAIMYSIESPLNKKVKKLISSIYMDSLNNSEKLINREIIEFFPLALIGGRLFPEVWADSNNKLNLDGSKVSLKQLEILFFEKVSTRYSKNMELILKNLLLLFGSFHLQMIQWLKTSDIRHVSLSKLEVYDLSLLKFIFKYIVTIIDKVILNHWDKDLNNFEYLAIVRIIFLWLQTNKFALDYSQDDPSFNQKLALLLNSIIQSRITKNVLYNDENILVKRQYIFEEEIMLRDFACITIPKFVGISDEDMYKQGTSIDRFYGHVSDDNGNADTEMTVKAENYIRLESIIIFGKQYMKFNRCGIKLNKETGQYNIPLQLTKAVTIKSAPKKIITLEKIKPNRGILKLKKKSENDSSAVKAKKDTVLSFEEIEAKQKDNQQKQAIEWGYSGSSAVAPSSITVKPSFRLPDPNESVTEKTGLTSVLSSKPNNENINSNNVLPQNSSSINQVQMEKTFENISIQTPNVPVIGLNQENNNGSGNTNYTPAIAQKMVAYPPGIIPPSHALVNTTFSNYMNTSLVNTSFKSISGTSQDVYFKNATYPAGYTPNPNQYLSQPSTAQTYSGYPFQYQMFHQGNMGVQAGIHFWQNDYTGHPGPYINNSPGIIPPVYSNPTLYPNQYMSQGYPTFHSSN